MGDSLKRVLFVNSETVPFLPETPIAKIGRYLPQGIQDRKKEIRTFMPRYGCINERKNQLHEVIRLSGMNIIIGDVDRQLVIKVASITAARIQVYFIDNDDYFKRKQLTYDANGKFFEDNSQRAIFFARGVLETVKKLRWAPDIVHCSGWITSLVPMYLKKVYHRDPIFTNCKIVSSLYGEINKETFAPGFANMVRINGIKTSDVPFKDPVSGINLAELAALYSDGVIFSSKDVDKQTEDYCKKLKIPVLQYDEKLFEDDSYIDEYDKFYEQL
ncbi:MAG: glycogen/starch synthase [Bacteroidales bacterium]|nr:glycogen/starch synthase [Bacteroidales bacterium]MDY6000771.1 glycogen/starch synthase [Candidatus Cryptobacteroides sp.]